MAPSESRRLLLVHAHPDDETLSTGATMARYAASGAEVTLITCTLGEEGEVRLPDKAHLAADQQDALGPHRLGELTEAMAALGIDDHRRLGGDFRYRDSGMMGTPANARPEAFWNADLLEAATLLVEVIREVRPQVVVTYDDFGGYGHPDHIQAHRVTMYAVSLAAVPSFRPDLGEPWRVLKVYWAALPRQAVVDAVAALADKPWKGAVFGGLDPMTVPFLTDDELVTTVVDGTAHLEAKVAAMRAHASQLTPDEFFFALAEHAGPEALGREHFRLALVADGIATDTAGHEDDLFHGIVGAADQALGE